MLELDTAPAVRLASTFWMIQELGIFCLKIKWLQAFFAPIMLRRRAWLAVVPASIAIFVTTILIRKRAKRQIKSIDRLVNCFSVRRAACVREGDRAPVERNILMMLKSMGLLASDGGHDEGMDMFDEVVRDRLPTKLDPRYRYTDALTVGIALYGEAFDCVASDLSAGESIRFLAPRVWYWIAWYITVFPLVLLALSTLAKQFLTCEGFCDRMYTTCAAVATIGVITGLGAVNHYLRDFSATSDMILVVYVLFTLFGAVLAYWMMNQRSMCRQGPKHRTTKVESMRIGSTLHFPLELGGSTSGSTTREVSDARLSSVPSEDPVGEMAPSRVLDAGGRMTRSFSL